MVSYFILAIYLEQAVAIKVLRSQSRVEVRLSIPEVGAVFRISESVCFYRISGISSIYPTSAPGALFPEDLLGSHLSH